MQFGNDPSIDRSPAQVNVARNANDPNDLTYAIYGNRRDVAALAGEYALPSESITRHGL